MRLQSRQRCQNWRNQCTISTKLYEAAAAEMAEEKDESGDDGVVDADFEVVDSEEEED